MPHFPEAVYNIVFAPRQSTAASVVEAELQQTDGLLKRVATSLGYRAAAKAPLGELDEHEDYLEYHNPSLGLSEDR